MIICWLGQRDCLHERIGIVQYPQTKSVAENTDQAESAMCLNLFLTRVRSVAL